MPILAAAFPVIDDPDTVDIDAEFRETRQFSFRSIDGQTILPFTGNEFVARWGIQGLDVPPRQLVEEASPNRDGTQVTDIKIGSRGFTIPLFIGSNSGHLDYLRDRALMRSFFNHRRVDYRAAGGTFDVVAHSVLGDRSLRSFYVDGMNGSWDQETSGTHWETFGLQGLAQWPYWNGGRWTSESIRRTGTDDRFFDIFPPRLSAKNLLNTGITFSVEGDVDSYLQIDGVGGCSSLLLEGDGLVIDIPDGLADGETLLIDSDPRSKRVLFDGETDWSRLSPLTMMPPLRTGVHEMSLQMDDPSVLTQIRLSGTKWYETPW